MRIVAITQFRWLTLGVYLFEHLLSGSRVFLKIRKTTAGARTERVQRGMKKGFQKPSEISPCTNTWLKKSQTKSMEHRYRQGLGLSEEQV